MRQPTTYYNCKGASERIQIHQGGTRSGKTYSIIQVLCEWCWKNQHAGWTITVVRKTFPSLRASVLRDFIDILETQGWYNPDFHNKSESTYNLFGNRFEFISVDQPQKVRGRKRNILFVNEANEITLEDWRQLMLRTTHKAIIDYNPSDEFSWIYDHVMDRPDSVFFKTTYRDNPYLDPVVVAEIERLKEADPDYWRVYGLGERGVNRATILTHWKEVEEVPEGWRLLAYGLDWGYVNDPSAVVAVYTDGQGLCLDEVLYATGMTNAQLADALRHQGVEKGDVLVADSAEPKSITDLHGHGFNIHPARKGRDSIRSGLDFLRSRPLMVTTRSANGIKELRNYRWKEDKNGRFINEPVDRYNHFVDAARYAATWQQTNPNFGAYVLG